MRLFGFDVKHSNASRDTSYIPHQELLLEAKKQKTILKLILTAEYGMFTRFCRTFSNKAREQYIHAISKRITPDRLAQQKTTTRLLRARNIRPNEVNGELGDPINGILYDDSCDEMDKLTSDYGEKWTHLGPYGVPQKKHKKLSGLTRHVGEYGTGLSVWTDDYISARLGVDWYGLDAGSEIPDKIGIVSDGIEHERLITNVDSMTKEEFLEKMKQFGLSSDWYFIVRVNVVPPEAAKCFEIALSDAGLARFVTWQAASDKINISELIFAGEASSSDYNLQSIQISQAVGSSRKVYCANSTRCTLTSITAAVSIAHTLIAVDAYDSNLADRIIELNKDLLGMNFKEIFQKFRENTRKTGGTRNRLFGTSARDVCPRPVESAQKVAEWVVNRNGKEVNCIIDCIQAYIKSVTNFEFKLPCQVPYYFVSQLEQNIERGEMVKKTELVNKIPSILNREWMGLRQAFYCFECRVNYQWFIENKKQFNSNNKRCTCIRIIF